MSEYKAIETTDLVKIANAIRLKKGGTDKISLEDMPAMIREIEGGGVKLPALTNEAAASELLAGKQLINDEGDVITGAMADNGTIASTMDGLNIKEVTIPAGYTSGGIVSLDNTIDNEVDIQADLLAQAVAALEGKAGGGSEPSLQSKSVTPSAVQQTVVPDSGYDGLDKVTVAAIPSTYVKPTATKAATTYTPTTSNQTIAAGTYCSGAQTIKGDANLVAGNIKSGVSIFGVAGSYEGSGGSGGSSDVELVYVTFMSHDGLKELHKRAVVSGNDCMEIVAGGLIDAPTRESTASQVFTFAGWSTVANGGLDENALKSVTADRTVYANYIEGVRHYTVSFYDGDTLLTTQSVAYGSAPVEYTPEKEGYKFDGWTPAFSAVKSDVSYYAKWIDMSSLLGFGDCGENATWTLTPEGVLTISGTGAVRHSGFGYTAGWFPQLDYVTSLVVEEGITGLGFQAVINLTNVVSVSLPSSLISIGDSAFQSLGATSIVIPAGVTTIDALAFNGAAITSATFVETSGWKADDTALAASNLANKATAATYLKKTYVGKKWTRS